MARIEVLKTYKLYIGGKFPRTESGRYYQPVVGKKPLGNICLASRKDFRNAVVAARKAQPIWGAATAYNRSQILYRMAEMLEGRKVQFIEEIKQQGFTPQKAAKEVDQTIDRLIHYAGWCDKYNQLFSAVNPVASSHFNFSTLEPMGVVAIVAPSDSPLLGLITALIPVIAGGNACVVVAAENAPLSSISFAEVLATSDLPGGVVNILTGKAGELLPHMASHMDVNAVLYCGNDAQAVQELQETAVNNLKRITVMDDEKWDDDKHETPYYISEFQEVKTTWHPIEAIAAAGSGY